MEEPKKLVYDSGAQPEEVFLRVSGTWTGTVCMSGSTRQSMATRNFFPTLR